MWTELQAYSKWTSERWVAWWLLEVPQCCCWKYHNAGLRWCNPGTFRTQVRGQKLGPQSNSSAKSLGLRLGGGTKSLGPCWLDWVGSSIDWRRGQTLRVAVALWQEHPGQVLPGGRALRFVLESALGRPKLHAGCGVRHHRGLFKPLRVPRKLNHNPQDVQHGREEGHVHALCGAGRWPWRDALGPGKTSCGSLACYIKARLLVPSVVHLQRMETSPKTHWPAKVLLLGPFLQTSTRALRFAPEHQGGQIRPRWHEMWLSGPQLELTLRPAELCRRTWWPHHGH